jgi:hypothetical protein
MVAERYAQQWQLPEARTIQSARAQGCHYLASLQGKIVQVDLMKPAGLNGRK